MNESGRMRGPLQGLRVVELAAIGPVPFCGMLLADMGAEILRIAPPAPREAQMPVPDTVDPLWRGRSRLTLDLKNAAHRERFLSTLPYAEVLIEGFRAGVLERLGIGPDVCLGLNPRLVIGRMTGWGQEGPLARSAGHDPNYLAITGVLHTIGYPDRPPCMPLNLVADFGGGAMYLAMGILAAVLHARASGQGQVVDAAMVDGAASLMSMMYSMRNYGLWTDQRGDNLLDGGAPFARTYETADGKSIVVCALEPQFYHALLSALGLDAATLPAQYDRSAWPQMRERFAGIFRTRTRDEWAQLLEGTDACVTPVLTMGEAPQHPHNRARGVFVGDQPMPAAAPRFSQTKTSQAQMNGGSPRDLLARWGMAAHEIDALT